ncbi:hypothetical protein [Prosthecobacter sp.]|uniref:hypothetical protein n=1 Tax=Prosthecobacter sp. TaxID=1965333 RepID=UPI0024878090|nr:hypothetical protein [Prosthecobacter sp.]MDI1311545.1 hypothetical protein [Prosthecobacter sp.]
MTFFRLGLLAAAISLSSCSVSTAPEPAEFQLSAEALSKQYRATRKTGSVRLYAQKIETTRDQWGRETHHATGGALLVKDINPPIYAQASEISITPEFSEVSGRSTVKKNDRLYLGEDESTKIRIDGSAIQPEGPHAVRGIAAAVDEAALKAEAEAKAAKESEAQKLAEAKAQAKAEALVAEESEAKAKAETKAQAKALALAEKEAKANAKAEATAQARSLALAEKEAKANAKAEAEKAEREAMTQAKAESERATAEAEAMKNEAKAKADKEQMLADAMAKKKADAQAKVAEERARADERARLKAAAVPPAMPKKVTRAPAKPKMSAADFAPKPKPAAAKASAPTAAKPAPVAVKDTPPPAPKPAAPTPPVDRSRLLKLMREPTER